MTGARVGRRVGRRVGLRVGAPVFGALVGSGVGALVGCSVGLPVGEFVATGAAQKKVHGRRTVSGAILSSLANAISCYHRNRHLSSLSNPLTSEDSVQPTLLSRLAIGESQQRQQEKGENLHFRTTSRSCRRRKTRIGAVESCESCVRKGAKVRKVKNADLLGCDVRFPICGVAMLVEHS